MSRGDAHPRVLGIAEVKTLPCVSRSYFFVECTIQTIREDLPDYVLFWNQLDLECKLSAVRIYHDRYRIHGGGQWPYPRRAGWGVPTRNTSGETVPLDLPLPWLVSVTRCGMRLPLALPPSRATTLEVPLAWARLPGTARNRALRLTERDLCRGQYPAG